MAGRRFTLALAVALLAAVAFGVYAYQGRGQSAPTLADSPLAVDFPLYSAGDSFEGNALTGITRRLDKADPVDAATANFVGFRYGDCEVGEDGSGCAGPLQIQVWPACERTRSSYTMGGEPLPREDLVVRGAPASFFEEGQRLEIYTGPATIVLFGIGPDQLKRAAHSLRGVAGSSVKPGAPLPAPAAGALEGELTC
jgi:hypothetical protein